MERRGRKGEKNPRRVSRASLHWVSRQLMALYGTPETLPPTYQAHPFQPHPPASLPFSCPTREQWDSCAKERTQILHMRLKGFRLLLSFGFGLIVKYLCYFLFLSLCKLGAQQRRPEGRGRLLGERLASHSVLGGKI